MTDLSDPSILEISHIEESLGSNSQSGLSASDAAARLTAGRPNELVLAKPTSLLRTLVGQFANPLIWLLLVAVAISLTAWIVEGARGVPVDAIVVTVIIVANAVLGLVQEKRASDAVAALNSATDATSMVLRDGELTQVATRTLVPGDVLALNEGDTVGADGRITAAASLRASESSLTGESETVEKGTSLLPGRVGLGDRTNMVFKGTSIAQGTGRAIVTGTGMSTELGSIAGLLHSTKERSTPLEREIARIGKTLSVAVIAIALIVMVTIVIVDGVTTAADLMVVLLLGVSLAVAAVPEGLPAILSVVLALGVQRMAGRSALVKKLNSVEALGAASVICSDKTGTLTRNEMTIQVLVTASGRTTISGLGYAPEGEVDVQGGAGSPASATEADLLLIGGSVANNAQLAHLDGEWQIQGDPTEAAFLVAARKTKNGNPEEGDYERLLELPFTSERKIMSTVNRESSTDETVLFTKGAPDVLLERCTQLQVGDRVVPMSDELRARAVRAIEELSDAAYRTLSVAYRRMPKAPASAEEALESDLVYVGVAGIIDPPRAEAATAIAEAHRAGIRVIMITGDHPRTAVRIAADLGIVDSGSNSLTGTEMDGLDDTQLLAATRDTSVFARVSPHHKLRLVDALQRDGHIVSMTGDGVNDAPALKAADVGVAMGITGTGVSKEAAKVILADDNFATIVDAVHEGRNIFDNIRKFLRYLLSSNTGEVLTVFLGAAFAGVLGLADASPETVVLPLLATQILWMNLLTDSGPALAMGVDREVGDAMSRNPRPASAHAIDGRMWGGVVAIGLVMAIISLLTLDLYLPGGLIPGTHSLDVARTAGFTTLVFAQLFNALNSRSESISAFSRLFTNRWLWAAISLGVILQVAVVEVPILQLAFGTASLTPGQWLTCVAISSTVLWFDELRKLLIRRVDASRAHQRTLRGQSPVAPR